MTPEEITQALAIARAHGANEADAAVFADHYLGELTEFRKVEEEGEEKSPEEWALEFSLVFLSKYQQQRAAGHSELWAKTYAASLEEGETAVEQAYAALGTGRDRRDVTGAVYREAYDARLHQGHCPEYAAAYAQWVVDVDSYDVEKYIAAYAEARESGHSVLYANEYAPLLCGEGYSRRAAAMTAEFYEQAITDGLPEWHAHLYADQLSEALYARGGGPADRVFHTLRVEGYVAGHRHASEHRLPEPDAFGEHTSTAYLNTLGELEDEAVLPDVEVRQTALAHALQYTLGKWANR